MIQNGSGPLPSAPSTPARGYKSRRILAAAALIGAAVTPLLVAAYWVKDGVRGPVHNVSAQILPAFVLASSASGAHYRTLILRPHGTELDYQVVRQGDPSLGEPELSASSAAGAALSRQVAALGTPDGADAGDPGLVLGSFGIRWVMLPSPVDPTLASRLDTAVGLVAQNKGPAYDLWQVAGPVGRVRVVAPSGATTVLASGTVDLGGATAPASGGTLILAEPYGGWTAKLNGHALKPVATPVGGWAQGFVLPPGGGQLSITRNNLARPLSLLLELVATLAAVVLALPGKRADPAEEAEALAALHEVKDSEQADADADEPQAGVGHRALSRMERLRLSRKFRTGRATPDNAPESPALGNQLPTVTAIEAAPDAEFAELGRGAAAAASPRRTGQDDQARDTGQRPSVPPPAIRGPSAAEPARWGTESLDLPVSAPGASPQNDEDWLNALLRDAGVQRRPSAPESPSLGWETDPQDEPPAATGRPRDSVRKNTSSWKSALGRMTGQQPAPPEASLAPARQEPSQRESPPLGGPAPEPAAAEERPPWEFESNRALWDSGPQPPVTSPEAPPAPGEGPKSAWGTDAKSAWGTAALPAIRTGARPTFTPTGPQPTFTPTGPQPTFTPTGAQPTFTPSTGQPDGGPGTQPVRRALRESGDWGKAPDRDGTAGNRDASPVPNDTSDRDQTTGRDAAPTAEPPARADKPERHRGGKHGKPSRWRGSGGRSGGDGES